MSAVKPREPGSFADATTIIAAALTVKGAGEVIDTGPGRVYAASDPDQLNYSPFNLHQAVKLDAAYRERTGHDGPLLRAYQLRYRDLTAGLPEASVAPMDIIAAVADESNDVVQAIIRSQRKDGDAGRAITPREALEVLKEIDDAMRTLEEARRSYAKLAGVAPGIRAAGVSNLINARAS